MQWGQGAVADFKGDGGLERDHSGTINRDGRNLADSSRRNRMEPLRRAHRPDGYSAHSRGREMAKAIGPLACDRIFALVLTSPLQRARETCQEAGFGDVAMSIRICRNWITATMRASPLPKFRASGRVGRSGGTVPQRREFRARGGARAAVIARAWRPMATWRFSRTATSCAFWPLAGWGSRRMRRGCSRSPRRLEHAGL